MTFSKMGVPSGKQEKEAGIHMNASLFKYDLMVY
jgi:hypothetical protein